MKILIAEDDLTSRAMLEAVLCKWGYEVITAADGSEAWAVMQQKDAPQLLVLDWMMPGMDGADLCRQLRAKEDQAAFLYILFLTSKAERRDIVSGLEAGADDYIVKPFDNEELRARVNAGHRIIALQNMLRDKEKLQGALEMAGAVCHELNQPLQIVSGWSELILLEISENDSSYKMLSEIKAGIDRIGELTRKIMKISQYRSKDYLGGKSRIIDIDSASM